MRAKRALGSFSSSAAECLLNYTIIFHWNVRYAPAPGDSYKDLVKKRFRQRFDDLQGGGGAGGGGGDDSSKKSRSDSWGGCMCRVR